MAPAAPGALLLCLLALAPPAMAPPAPAAGALALDCAGLVAAAGLGMPGTRWALAVRIEVAHVREPWVHALEAGGLGPVFALQHVFHPLNVAWAARGEATLQADGRVVARAACEGPVALA